MTAASICSSVRITHSVSRNSAGTWRTQGLWTPVAYYSDEIYATEAAAFEAALRAVTWLAEAAKRPGK